VSGSEGLNVSVTSRQRARRGVLVAAAVSLSLLTVGLEQASPPASGAATKKQTLILFGDSITSQASQYLKSSAFIKSHYTMVADYYPGIAPCNWFANGKLTEDGYANLAALLDAEKPPVAYIETVGSNETSCMWNAGSPIPYGSAPFVSDYENALDQLVMQLVAANPDVQIVYFGSPPVESSVTNSTGLHLLSYMRWLQAFHLKNLIVNTTARVALGGPGDVFKTYLRCLKSETAKMGCVAKTHLIQVRKADGVHFYCKVPEPASPWTCRSYSSGAFRWSTAVINRLKVVKVPKFPAGPPTGPPIGPS
jgi:lysophospholipase L1-like esterase